MGRTTQRSGEGVVRGREEEIGRWSETGADGKFIEGYRRRKGS